jgi:hypothetical protein
VSIDAAAEAAAVLPKSPTDLNSSSRTIHRVCVGLLHLQSATASWCCSAGCCPALPAHPQPALHCCSRLLRTPAVCSGLLVCVCASVLHSSTAVSIALLVCSCVLCCGPADAQPALRAVGESQTGFGHVAALP